MNDRYKNVCCVTDHKVAYESPDHICPVGAINDNTTNSQYLDEVKNYFEKVMGITNRGMNYADLGCAGGQLAVELALRENFSIGIEGSDLPIKNKLHNWPKYYGSVLHTADLTKPFYITRDNEKVLFDVISSWEVVEHIHPTQLDSYFENVLANLSDNGIFVASINTGPDIRRDSAGNLHYLHQSVFQEQYWREKLLKKYNVVAYPFQNKVRNCDNSFFVGLKK